MKFLTTNLCTEAATTVTASTSDANFPVSNLKHPFRSKRWRSTGCTSESVVYDMQTIEPVDSVVILWPKEDGIKLTSSAVVKIQANATNVWTSPAIDQTLTINDDYSVASHYFSSDQEYRFWKLVITDATNPWGYIEVGMAWIGKSLAISNAQNGFDFEIQDRSKSVETDFGHKYTDEYPQSVSVKMDYRVMDYSDVVILQNAYRANGNRKPVIVSIDPEEAVFNKDHFMVYGLMSNKMQTSHINYNLFNIDGVIVEELS